MALTLTTRLKCVMLLLMTLAVVYGASKGQTEADLRAKLAASEEERAQVLIEKAELVTTVKKLAAKAARDNTQIGHSITGQAAQDASRAQDNAALNVEAIRAAADAAASAALTAQAQANKFNINSMTLIYVQIVILIGILAGFVNSALLSARDHKWAMQAAKETKAAVDKVETNTNSMVEIMRKAAFADGFAHGKQTEGDAIQEGKMTGQTAP